MTSDETGGAPAQPEGQGQPATPEPAVQAPAPTEAPAQGSGPWANDLQGFPEDVRGQVDTFLREKVQPYVTTLESERKEFEEAAGLYHAFEKDPVQTYVEVTRELFDDGAANRLIEALQAQENPDAPVPGLEGYQFGEEQPPEVPQHVQEAVEYVNTQRQKEAYDAELARVKEANQDVTINEKAFHPFVVANDGDFDAALTAYTEFLSEFTPKEQTPTVDPSEVPAAPEVLASDTSAPSTPPTETKHTSIDDAIDEFFAEQRTAPPVVGSV